MRYFLLNTRSSTAPEYCYCDRVEDDEGMIRHLAIGVPRPSNVELRAHLANDRLGLRLASRIAVSDNLIIMSRAAFDGLATALHLGDHEVHTLMLINHKRRVHSRDYVLLNPLEHHELAHPNTHFERYPSTGRIHACERWILETTKLVAAPDMTRSAELPWGCFVSERFVNAVETLGLSNFVFEDVEHR